MTPDEIVRAAHGLLGDVTDQYPAARAVAYRRISARQREIFIHLGTIDPEFTGEDVILPLTDGAVNLVDLEQSEDVFPVEAIEILRVHEKGTSSLTAGDRVTIVPNDDIEAFLPPRVTHRSHVLRQVAEDLGGVVSLRMSYSRRPRPIGVDGSGTIELLEPFQDLLSFDLAMHLARLTIALEGEKRAAAIAIWAAEETELMAGLEAHVRNRAAARESRF